MRQELKDRIENLSASQRKMLIQKALWHSGTPNINQENVKAGRLVAYIEAADGLNAADLKDFLRHKLPNYMIPDDFVIFDKIPTLPNGKIDKKALKSGTESKPSGNGNGMAESAIEKQLIKIWEGVLGFEPIGRHDNFFEIGGDSILSIQILSKARKIGLKFKPNDLFENQTIARLARLTGIDTKEETNVTDTEGEVELTPIQHWFFETHRTAPHYWNQIAEVSGISAVTPERLEELLLALVRHHQGLQMGFVLEGGHWRARITYPVPNAVFKTFTPGLEHSVDLQDGRIREMIREEQDKTSLDSGALFRALFFDCNGAQANKLFLVAHHLLVDMISWDVIRLDFLKGISQISSGGAVAFEDSKGMLKAWGKHACTYANSAEVMAEMTFWDKQSLDEPGLPYDRAPESPVFEERHIETLLLCHEIDISTSLRKLASEAYNTSPEDLLITALLKTYFEWTGNTDLCLGLERTGRKLYDSPVDISETIGWFTSFFPVKLHWDPDYNLEEQVKAVKEQLKAIPEGGVGYGLLRYLNRDERIRNKLSRDPQIIFNYLGIRQPPEGKTGISLNYTSEGHRHPHSERTYALEINVYMINGLLHVNLSYPLTVFLPATIDALGGEFIKNITQVIHHCVRSGKTGYTPSDFPEANISQDDLDTLLRNL